VHNNALLQTTWFSRSDALPRISAIHLQNIKSTVIIFIGDNLALFTGNADPKLSPNFTQITP
jgi:hypothetical protein